MCQPGLSRIGRLAGPPIIEPTLRPPGKAACADRSQDFVNRMSMHFTLRKTTLFCLWRRELALLVAIGMILGWLGPYGTYGCFGVPERFAFWTLRSLVVGAICLAAFELVSAIGPAATWPPLKRTLASVLIAS